MKANQSLGAHSRGFTLVELVVAMVIVAVLAAIAIPSYTIYVLKSHRSEVKSALLDAASLEERFFSTSNTYTTSPPSLGYGATTVTPFPVGTGYYNITSITVNPAVPPTALVPGGTPATFVITAVPTTLGNQQNDTACALFTISSAGQQTAQNSGGTDNTAGCWQN